MALRALHLCSGYGGFELALRGIARTVAHVERDCYAAATLVARMAEARLDQAPIWDDLTTFDGDPWCGRVDLITAGFPCQPFSAAGKRLGLDDDRWLWPDIERIIREVRPRFVFLENVPGVVRAGLPAVLHSLAALGFYAEWCLLAASDVGAPHRRQRFWLVAHHDDDGQSSIGREPEHHRDARHDADRPGRSHVDRCRHRFPPRPDDRDGWQRWDGAQPGVRRGTDGSTEWLADALHLGGNGLVPQCARAAWELLTARGGWSPT
jgi:DNA (cytosine-5)-methyltransferase 1